MNINNIGLFLLNSINKNNTDNKNNFLKVVKKYKEKKEDEQNKLLEDISYYRSNYESKRDQNNTLYDEYLQKRFGLYKKWHDSKKKIDLDNIFKLNRPPFYDVPEIYTKNRPRTKLK